MPRCIFRRWNLHALLKYECTIQCSNGPRCQRQIPRVTNPQHIKSIGEQVLLEYRCRTYGQVTALPRNKSQGQVGGYHRDGQGTLGHSIYFNFMPSFLHPLGIPLEVSLQSTPSHRTGEECDSHLRSGRMVISLKTPFPPEDTANAMASAMKPGCMPCSN